MKNKFITLFLLSFLSGSGKLDAQHQSPDKKKMEWFQDAKLGIFIHWGIYSVNGISESWSFFNNYINHENYLKQLDGFSAAKYDPSAWVSLIKNSGAKYSVITTRHHDGISLWDSKADRAITTSKNALVRSDVLTPFVTALQNSGLKTGLYYSLTDWSHPFYDINTQTKKRYEIKNDPERWNRFIKYYQTQLNELSTRYHPDVLWFDGDWEHTSEEWKAQQTLENLRKYNPNIIINSRLSGKGDFETPEQGIPVISPQNEYWELCYTMNDSWGYQPFDQHYKTPNMMIRTLTDVISMGGNLLLDIGPKSDGTIPEKQVEILKSLGRWTSKNKEAIYGTRRGLPFDNYKGKSAFSKDGKKLFLYLEEAKDFTQIDGLISNPVSARIIGDPNGKVHLHQRNEVWRVSFSNATFDQDVTVVELNFNEKIKFDPDIQKPTMTLSEILDTEDSKSAAYRISEQLHSGNNVFNNSGLTSDGLNMSLHKSNKTNPETIRWISKHAEALFETGKGLPNGHYPGNSVLSKDRKTLYLFVEGIPTGPVALKGIKNNIFKTRIVGEGSSCQHSVYNKLYWSDRPGIIYIDFPRERLDKTMTVIAVLFDTPVELYREKVGAIESNL